jgi:hypothetical protein
MRGATFHSVECMVAMCERDLEQMMRRMAELKGKLKALELGMVCASRDAHTTRTGAREAGARVPINLNSINIKGSGVMVDKSTARAPGISLGFMFRNLPQAIPHHFALWWWRSMKSRDWVLAKGGFVDCKNWKYQISAWYKHVDTNETSEAKEEYERFFGKAFPRQEETAAEEWESTCRGCDNYWSGHCVACANVPPKSAAECKRFKAMEGGAA